MGKTFVFPSLLSYFRFRAPFPNRAAKFLSRKSESLFLVMKLLISMTKPKKRVSRKEKLATKISKQHLYVITSQPKCPFHERLVSVCYLAKYIGLLEKIFLFTREQVRLHESVSRREESKKNPRTFLYTRPHTRTELSSVGRESKDIQEPLSILTLTLPLKYTVWVRSLSLE
jgi:hypothetical protein